MTQFNEQNLEKWAKTITASFVDDNVPLTDGVVKVAERENLNQEQTRRLVEAVNTNTFLHKFNSMAKTGGENSDRNVEFETADADAVFSRMLTTAKTAMYVPTTTTPQQDEADFALPLPATRYLSTQTSTETQKTAGVRSVETTRREPRIKRASVVSRLRKTAEYLKDQDYQARFEYTGAVQNLVDSFRRIDGPSFDAFEKDAYYQYGEDAIPQLQLLRQSLLKAPGQYTDVQTMHKHARYIDTETPEMVLFQKMLETTQQCKTAAAALKLVESDLRRVNV